MMLCKFFD